MELRGNSWRGQPMTLPYLRQSYGDDSNSYACITKPPDEMCSQAWGGGVRVGDYGYLRVSPMRGVKRYGAERKLSPQFIGLLQVLDKVGAVPYRIALPPSSLGVHGVFHVSDPKQVWGLVYLCLDQDFSYEEKPVQVLDKKDEIFRTKMVPLVKVL